MYLTTELVFVFLSVLLAVCSAVHRTKSCSYEGHVYRLGDHWVATDTCNGCTCTEYGTQCTNNPCSSNKVLGKPGDYLCFYYQQYYKLNEEWVAVDHCNTCTCTSRGMRCTVKPCKNTGFAKPQTGRLGDCNYHGSWYLHLDQWLAQDGCNTCVCVEPGNYRGLQICTENKCVPISIGK